MEGRGEKVWGATTKKELHRKKKRNTSKVKKEGKRRRVTHGLSKMAHLVTLRQSSWGKAWR